MPPFSDPPLWSDFDDQVGEDFGTPARNRRPWPCDGGRRVTRRAHRPREPRPSFRGDRNFAPGRSGFEPDPPRASGFQL